jgi:hypothetical protein
VSAYWNERLGWLLLLIGFCAAIGLDPWSLSERDPSVLPGSARMAARHAQAVVLAMGLLQLAVAQLLWEAALVARLRNAAGFVLGVGTLVYTAGYIGQALRAGDPWLISVGAAINLLGFLLLGWAAWGKAVTAELRIVLVVFLLGMTIDVVSGLYAVDRWRGRLIDLDPEIDVRQRMLRLARVAATALSLLTLLSRDRIAEGAAQPGIRWSRFGLLIGTAGMPAVLTAASFVYRDLKYLLPIPALAFTGGVLGVLLQANRTAPPLEQWGWLLVVLSMSIGLAIGLYAFDGPLPTPDFVGPYNEFVRRLIRLGHAYAIVFGLLAILLARRRAGRFASNLLVAGSRVSILSIVLLGFLKLPTAILAVGPVFIVLALLGAIRWGIPPEKKNA